MGSTGYVNSDDNKEFGLDDARTFLLTDGDEFIHDRVVSFGMLRLPKGSAEALRCEEVLAILADYARRKSPPRPLSIAVFGPPGSGKSFTVKQLAKCAQASADVPFAESVTINLSQLVEPRDLAKSLADVFRRKKGDTKGIDQQTRLVFLDEFDCKQLDWLQAFLAPMQDGEFLDDEGKPCHVGKAVFVFAGGTADRFDDFPSRHEPYFANKKGPDFVSRLRGVLDIEGVNGYTPDRILRRALVLQHQIAQREPKLVKAKKRRKGTVAIQEELLTSLLAVGYYKHGARSMEALLDMCTLTDANVFYFKNLPPPELRSLHVSRGSLDGKTIGISAGEDDPSQKFLRQLSKALVERGANLAYGGQLRNGGTLASIREAVAEAPNELLPRAPHNGMRLRCFHAFPTYHHPEYSDKDLGPNIVFERLETLNENELAELHIKPGRWFAVWSDPPADASTCCEQSRQYYEPRHHLAWALSLFRMRLRMARDIDALVVVGGKERQSWGRFSGVAEEVLLALAYNKPVYVLGMSQGAAGAVGELLGLGEIEFGVPACLREPDDFEYAEFRGLLEKWSDRFYIPHKPDLPKTHAGVASYILGHALRIENGLSDTEKRRLFAFAEDQTDQSIEHIVRGLHNLQQRDA